jgi:DNA-binding IclR family transcriptional regulator
MANQNTTHRSLDRALQILMEFTPENRLKGLSELSESTGIHPSTVSRLLNALSERGFVEQDENSRKFILGKAVADLGRAFFRSIQGNLVTIARPIIDELSAQIEETIALEIWSGRSTILSYRTSASHRLQVTGEIGSQMPLHTAAGAKAVLAHSEPDFVNRILKDKLEKFTQNTITDPTIFKQQLKDIRKEGIAVDREEMEMGVYAIGAPIFDVREKPVAGIVLTFPINRLESCNSKENITKLKDAAWKISSLLFHSLKTRGG